MSLAPDAINYAPPCGECGRPMRLQTIRGAPCYFCHRCALMHGAHADGRPFGKPADRETHAARREAHAGFDRLWRGSGAPMGRESAYRWLAFVLGCTSEDAHIGRLTLAECQRVIAEFEKLVPQLRAAPSGRAQRGGRAARLRRRAMSRSGS